MMVNPLHRRSLCKELLPSLVHISAGACTVPQKDPPDNPAYLSWYLGEVFLWQKVMKDMLDSHVGKIHPDCHHVSSRYIIVRRVRHHTSASSTVVFLWMLWMQGY